jgi:HK97 family phage major capsid protein
MKNRFLSVRAAVETQLLNPGKPERALTDEQREAQQEMRSAYPSGPGLIVPFTNPERRDMTATDTTSVAGDQGGMTVGVAVPEIGPALRSALRLPDLGARFLTGLTGEVNLPHGLGTISAEWLAENASASDVAETLNVLSLSPHRVTASVPVSMQLIAQGGPAFDAWLNSELLDLLGVEIERVAIAGTGSLNQPLGILANPGIGSVEGGADGAAPDYADLCDLEYAVTGTGKADRGPTGWLCSPKARRKLRQTYVTGVASGSSLPLGPIWPLDSADRLLGHPAGVTNAVPDNLVKGGSGSVCSALVFGSFSELFIGLWGAGIAVEVTKSRAQAIAGMVTVNATAYVDCGIRTPSAFASMQDALCA